MGFKEAVSSAGLRYHAGLQALTGKDRQNIQAENTRNIAGSAALDEDLAKNFPHACRWDYAVGYENGVSPVLYFIEIHPSSGEKTANEIQKKKKWLLSWLDSEGRPLKAYGTKKCFCWVSSSRNLPPKNANIYRIAAAVGVDGPLPRLTLE